MKHHKLLQIFTCFSSMYLIEVWTEPDIAWFHDQDAEKLLAKK